MVHVIQDKNWCNAIGEIIRTAADGDIIMVDTTTKAILAKKAILNQCPGKHIQVEVGQAAA